MSSANRSDCLKHVSSTMTISPNRLPSTSNGTPIAKGNTRNDGYNFIILRCDPWNRLWKPNHNAAKMTANNKSEKQDAKMFDFKCIMAPLERFAIVRDAKNHENRHAKKKQ